MCRTRQALLSLMCLLALAACAAEEQLEDVYAQALVKLDSDEIDTRSQAEQTLLHSGPAILRLIRHSLAEVHAPEVRSRISEVANKIMAAALAAKLPQPLGALNCSDLDGAFAALSAKLDIPIKLEAPLEHSPRRLQLAAQSTVAGALSELNYTYGLNLGLGATQLVATRRDDGNSFNARYELRMADIPTGLLLSELDAILQHDALHASLNQGGNTIEVDGTLKAHLRVLEVMEALRAPILIGSEATGLPRAWAAADTKRFSLRVYDCSKLVIRHGIFGPPRLADLIELLVDRVLPASFASPHGYIAEFGANILVIQRAPVHRCIEAVLTHLAKHIDAPAISFAPEQLLVRPAEVDAAVAAEIGRVSSHPSLQALLFDLTRAPLIAAEFGAYLFRTANYEMAGTTVSLYFMADLTHAPELAVGQPPHELTSYDIQEHLRAVFPKEWDPAQARSITEWGQDWLQIEQTPALHARIWKELNTLRLLRLVLFIRTRIQALTPFVPKLRAGGLGR